MLVLSMSCTPCNASLIKVGAMAAGSAVFSTRMMAGVKALGSSESGYVPSKVILCATGSVGHRLNIGPHERCKMDAPSFRIRSKRNFLRDSTSFKVGGLIAVIDGGEFLVVLVRSRAVARPTIKRAV